ncbi:hypothetical protein GCM10010495_02140 [Kitasatospora herbaricolor]|uniref:Uncharacterized protein n=1 Tax=Kitasatospora indigofera TaxID=67307 RepID=A0A919FEG6_9ACTN|nr:hypothetical protein GCM10010495_02140 [Kitasatospora herbaricolor]GHH63040.1 hypothetical protein GCM10018781_11850 [Kitasatospora indigofera]
MTFARIELLRRRMGSSVGKCQARTRIGFGQAGPPEDPAAGFARAYYALTIRSRVEPVVDRRLSV